MSEPAVQGMGACIKKEVNLKKRLFLHNFFEPIKQPRQFDRSIFRRADGCIHLPEPVVQIFQSPAFRYYNSTIRSYPFHQIEYMSEIAATRDCRFKIIDKNTFIEQTAQISMRVILLRPSRCQDFDELAPGCAALCYRQQAVQVVCPLQARRGASGQ